MANSENLEDQALPSDATAPVEGAPAPAGGSNRWLMLITMAVLAGGVGGYLTWEVWAKQRPGPLHSQFLCASPDCGFQEARSLQMGESFPLACPKCRQNTLYVGHRCPNCSHLNIMNELRDLPGPTQCSQCGTEIRHAE